PGPGAPAAGARPDDHDVAVERRVTVDRGGPEGLGRGAGQLPERTVVADRIPRRIASTVPPGEHVVEQQRALAQRLEHRTALGQTRVSPSEQRPLSLIRRQRAEAL